MIIDYSINSKTYVEKTLDFSGIFTYTCPKCGANHKWNKHGTYSRCFITITDDKLNEEAITILRLKCTSCNSTHAILPYDVIPYKIYSFFCIIYLLVDSMTTEPLKEPILHKQKRISYQLLYKFLDEFLKQLKNITLHLRSLSLWDDCFDKSKRKLLKFLLDYPEKEWFLSNYLENNGKPLFLFRQSTSSYPFTIGYKII